MQLALTPILSSVDLTEQILQGFIPQLPTMLVSFMGMIFCVVFWKRSRAASLWGMAGFGLALLISILNPIVQPLVIGSMKHGSSSSMSDALMVLSLFWSLGRALTYIFLLVAIYAGRSPSQISPPSPPRFPG